MYTVGYYNDEDFAPSYSADAANIDDFFTDNGDTPWCTCRRCPTAFLAGLR